MFIDFNAVPQKSGDVPWAPSPTGPKLPPQMARSSAMALGVPPDTFTVCVMENVAIFYGKSSNSTIHGFHGC